MSSSRAISSESHASADVADQPHAQPSASSNALQKMGDAFIRRVLASLRAAEKAFERGPFPDSPSDHTSSNGEDGQQPYCFKYNGMGNIPITLEQWNEAARERGLPPVKALPADRQGPPGWDWFHNAERHCSDLNKK